MLSCFAMLHAQTGVLALSFKNIILLHNLYGTIFFMHIAVVRKWVRVRWDRQINIFTVARRSRNKTIQTADDIYRA